MTITQCIHGHIWKCETITVKEWKPDCITEVRYKRIVTPRFCPSCGKRYYRTPWVIGNA